MLNSSFNRAKNLKSLLFSALVREACRSQYFWISDWYVVSRAHKLPCFAQSANFFVYKQTNKHPTNRPITLPLVRVERARGTNTKEWFMHILYIIYIYIVSLKH